MAKRVSKDVGIVKALISANKKDSSLSQKVVPKKGQIVKAKGSSNLKEFQYNEATKTLSITFLKGNATYEFYNVPKQVYDKLVAAPSRGEYFHANIRFKYKQKKV